MRNIKAYYTIMHLHIFNMLTDEIKSTNNIDKEHSTDIGYNWFVKSDESYQI